MTKTVSITEVRERLGHFIGKVAKTLSRCVITSKGSPRAVLISLEEYESWNATQEVLSSKEELAGIQRGIAELKAGQTSSFEEVFGEPLDGKKIKRGQFYPQRC